MKGRSANQNQQISDFDNIEVVDNESTIRGLLPVFDAGLYSAKKQKKPSRDRADYNPSNVPGIYGLNANGTTSLSNNNGSNTNIPESHNIINSDGLHVFDTPQFNISQAASRLLLLTN